MTAEPKTLSLENFPCGSLPETHAQMKQARPCPRCRSKTFARFG
jgi:hypothetical protein